MLWLVLKIRRSKNDHRKIYLTDLDSPRRELSTGGLGIIIALSVCWQINFCVHLLGVHSSCITCMYTQTRYYWAYAHQLWLPSTNNKFDNKPRHLRRTWDLGTRIFGEANLILLQPFLFGNYLERYLKKRPTQVTQNWTKMIWILLAVSFLYVVSDMM